MPSRLKPITQYIESQQGFGANQYVKSPASTFLDQIVDIADADSHCLRKFPRKTNGDLTQASEDSHKQINSALLVTIMGHFELYQRFTFAGLVEYSIHLSGFSLKDAVRRLSKDFSFQVDPIQVLAYRGTGTVSGQLIVDSLPGWHDPDRVNAYFKAFLPKLTFYSNAQSRDIRVLWQLRHSIAHSGAWLSIPDAQKVTDLNKFRNKALFFAPRFIEAVVKRFHKIVPDCTSRLKTAFNVHVIDHFSTTRQYTQFFAAESPRRSWL